MESELQLMFILVLSAALSSVQLTGIRGLIKTSDLVLIFFFQGADELG